MAKLMRNLLILFIIFCIWLSIDLNYSAAGDANDRSNSIQRMMKWSPFSAAILIEDFGIAAENIRGTNLDGLNVDEIHEIAIKKRDVLYRKQIEIMKSILLNDAEPIVVLKFNASDDGELIKRKDLEMRLIHMENALIENQKDADSSKLSAGFRRAVALLDSIINHQTRGFRY